MSISPSTWNCLVLSCPSSVAQAEGGVGGLQGVGLVVEATNVASRTPSLLQALCWGQPNNLCMQRDGKRDEQTHYTRSETVICTFFRNICFLENRQLAYDGYKRKIISNQ